jgi:outer membrane protein assembly factor BamB
VTPTDISDYLTKTENGFIIKLPGTTNVPSATVQDGKLYVSGGFGSTQYYSFDSKTGEKVWAVYY